MLTESAALPPFNRTSVPIRLHISFSQLTAPIFPSSASSSTKGACSIGDAKAVAEREAKIQISLSMSILNSMRIGCVNLIKNEVQLNRISVPHRLKVSRVSLDKQFIALSPQPITMSYGFVLCSNASIKANQWGRERSFSGISPSGTRGVRLLHLVDEF